jgi:hypothetical protein
LRWPAAPLIQPTIQRPAQIRWAVSNLARGRGNRDHLDLLHPDCNHHQHAPTPALRHAKMTWRWRNTASPPCNTWPELRRAWPHSKTTPCHCMACVILISFLSWSWSFQPPPNTHAAPSPAHMMLQQSNEVSKWRSLKIAADNIGNQISNWKYVCHHVYLHFPRPTCCWTFAFCHYIEYHFKGSLLMI